MDDDEENGDEPPSLDAKLDMGEHLRTWRLFVSLIQWTVVAAAVLLLILLLFRTHG
jgi:hypothetical protein